jgi:hypothetical protein
VPFTTTVVPSAKRSRPPSPRGEGPPVARAGPTSAKAAGRGRAGRHPPRRTWPRSRQPQRALRLPARPYLTAPSHCGRSRPGVPGPRRREQGRRYRGRQRSPARTYLFVRDRFMPGRLIPSPPALRLSSRSCRPSRSPSRWH